MITRFGIARIASALGILSAASISGCAEESLAGDSSLLPLAQHDDTLYLRLGATWADRDNVVPVCWANSGHTTEKGWIRDAVNATWAANSSLKFTWQEGCPTSGTARFVRFAVQDQASGADGQAGVGMAATFLLPTQGVSGTFRFASDGSANRARVEYVGVHEIGHVLGFHHEQDRPDNQSRCTDTVVTTSDGTYQTIYDQTSVMNYCGPNAGVLSASDKLGVAQAYARPDVHVAAVSVIGGQMRLSHAIRNSSVDQAPATSGWSTFADVEATNVAGDIGSPVAVAMDHNTWNQVHLLALNSVGDMYHTIRSPTGWLKFGNVKSVAGNPGTFTTVGAAAVDDLLHVVGTTSDGRIWHTLRSPSSWTQFGDIESVAGERGSFTAAAGSVLDGQLHVCAVTSDGHLWHSVRGANSWTQFGDVETVAGEIGTVTAVDCTAVSGQLHLLAVNSAGNLYHTIRSATSWTSFGNVKGVAGNVGSISQVASTQFLGDLQVTVVANATAYHTVRSSTGLTWTQFGNVESVAGDVGLVVGVAMD